MSFSNEKFHEAFISGEYICDKCGSLMRFEDEKWKDVLLCEQCGNSIATEQYGYTDEEYASLYPTLEEVLAMEDPTYEPEDNYYGYLFTPDVDMD